jgi:hypothetical protein
MGKGESHESAKGQLHEFTRRTLLGGAAAAGVATLVGPRAGLAAAVLGHRSVSATSIGALSGESAPIRAPVEFALAGIEWSGPRSAKVELRAQAPNGPWGPWVEASALGHDGDGQARSVTLFGEPVWVGSAIAVQLRTDRRLGGVRVHFVRARDLATERGGAAAAPPLAAPVLDAGPGQPPILARHGWARGQAPPVHVPRYGTVKLAFVHHTVNPNGYGVGEVPALLRAIYEYHVQVRGFWDIAYNFIIDAYGRIWEGRAGGIDMAVVGAHAGAYNTESTGVAMLGDFMGVAPSPAAISALKQLLAWKLSLHGLPATGRATVVVDPADAFYTPFNPGAHVSLPRIAGHRDGDLTDCPGDALYARLPLIRPRVMALAGTPAQLTVAAPSALITAGSTAQLAGALALLSGQPLAGEPLELQQLAPTVPPASTFQTLTTAADGSWSASVGFERNTLVRALHRPFPAAVSDWVEVAVAPTITLALQSASPLVVTGTVVPAKRRLILAVYPAGTSSGKPIKRKRIIAVNGAFSAQLPVPGPGSYTVVARTRADTANAAGVSAPLAVTVS